MKAFKDIVTVAMLGMCLFPAALLSAQNVDSERLLHPTPDSWPLYHGDYTGKRHSALAQITSGNVANLALSWVFQTGQTAMIKSTPLVADGMIYFTMPDNIWALDARSGHLVWRYTYPANDGNHIGQRGVGMYKSWLYFMSPDGHLVSLNAKDGTVRWNVVISDVKKGYWTTMPPLVVGNHVIVGVGGDFDNVPGYLQAIDPETGKLQWQWTSTAEAGTPNKATGGMTWMPGTYDPDLNLLYWGTGNPTPVLNGKTRPGDDLYSCSIVALNPDTGKLVWGFSISPHDTHDWDAVEAPVLVDADFHGQPRKMLMQASRNGYFFVLDRTNGKSLLTVPFGPLNWSDGVDKDGHPVPKVDKEPAPDGRIIAPDEWGLTNFRSPSFDPKTGLFLVSAHPSYSLYFAKHADGDYGWAGADYILWGTGILEAIDYQTGKPRWSHDLIGFGSGAGVLTTEGGLTFTGDVNGNLLALDTSNGKTLWHAGTGMMMMTSPITYELDGRQYVMTSSGGILFAWALPKTNTGD
jgi:alcohol dehydrogenase (cytochrome c)